jgi:hypothetical protein
LKNNNLIYFFNHKHLFVLIFTLLPGVFFAQTPNEADAAARDALRRLESALGGNVGAGTIAAPAIAVPPAPAQVSRGGRQPAWVDDVYSAYNREHFLAIVGSAANRDQAEARAFAALVALFGQSIKAEFTVAENYTEAVNRGVVNISQNTQVSEQITRAATMDRLFGAEIGNVWDDTRGTVHAVAFMDKARAISIYSDMIIVNNRNIGTLTAMNDDEKNSLDGYARFRLAALIAGINENYAAVISQLGGSVSVRSADSLFFEAANIIRNITVVVAVTNDRANRVQDTFARILGAEGLRTRGNNPRYTLEVRLNVNEVTFPGNNNIFCRIEGSANLIDNQTGASLFPFAFNIREGHTTFANAEDRAFREAERTIADQYPGLLRSYLASLIPIR